jgi:Protein of unknown function (DUF1523)
MRILKWIFIVLMALPVFGFLHYTLPQHDIVRIVGTENRRIDFGENSIFWASPDVGTTAGTSRDVFFINAIQSNGKTIEYRNEDTGWGWPPYFKMDSFSTQTEAKELISTGAAPVWVSITHYGWRNQLFTIFPNAVAVNRVDGPDVTIIPWVNIVLLTFFAIVILMARKMWMQFRERMIDPALVEAEETWDAVDARADRARDRASGWFGRLFGRK